jgi:hypothetical protein
MVDFLKKHFFDCFPKKNTILLVGMAGRLLFKLFLRYTILWSIMANIYIVCLEMINGWKF